MLYTTKASLIRLVSISIVVVLLSTTSVSAETNIGIKSRNFLSNFGAIFEKITLFFTFNSTSKTQQGLDYENKRLIEAQIVTKSNITDNKAKELVPNKKYQEIEAAIQDKAHNKTEEAQQITELVREGEQSQKEIAVLIQNSDHERSAKIEKLQKEIEVLKNINSLKSQEQSYKSANNIAPPNTILCNGIYWTPCQMGKRFYCPAIGNAQCLVENINQNNLTQSQIDQINEFSKKFKQLANQKEKQQESVRQQELKQSECITAPTPENQRILDPATQNYLRQIRCGTVTDADKTNYELSRIKSSTDELKYRLDSKISFPSLYLDPIKAPTFSNPRWEIRWEGSGGTISDSSGNFYQFHCESNTCRSY